MHSKKQADEINDLQRKIDQRFGDIAIEKGYLLKEEVTYLLNQQNNSYLLFLQICTENNILSLQELEQYQNQFKQEYGFSDYEIDALKSGDIDHIIPIFVDTDIPFYGDCVSLSIRNIIRFISDNVILNKGYRTQSYSCPVLCFQQLTGVPSIFLGFAGKERSLLPMASAFAKEAFDEMKDEALDSVCEFINCTNGLYATKLSHADIDIEMTPPEYSINKTITTTGTLFVVPMRIDGEQIDILVAVNDLIEIK